MAIMVNELNLLEIFTDLGKVCKTKSVCGNCAEKACLVGYAKNAAAECRIGKYTGIQDGFENIPPSDIRGGYDEYNVLYAIAHLLLQCKDCKEEHYENCLINIVRSCLEVIELGEEQEYKGNVIEYLVDVAKHHPAKAEFIKEEYMMHKNKKQENK